MNVTVERKNRDRLIRLEGSVSLASVGELKALLLEWLAAGNDLELDLDRVEEFDLTALQLLCAAAREASRIGVRIVTRASNPVITTVCDAGFGQVPGFPIQG